jgi:signal transduction histidine kinase
MIDSRSTYGQFMRIEVVALGLIATTGSLIAALAWWKSQGIARRLADVAAQRDRAESDRATLLGTLSSRNRAENERIYRLEHDIKSSLGVILGFSALLREKVEDDPASPLPLKNIDAIHQAATKILKTIEGAVADANAPVSQTTVANGKS